MNLWKRIEYWNLEASERFFHNDINTAILISIHALQYLHQHIVSESNDDNESSIHSYIDFISGYNCIRASADTNTSTVTIRRNSKQVPIIPTNDSKNINILNCEDTMDVQVTSSSRLSPYNHDRNDGICHDLSKTRIITSFHVYPVRQLLRSNSIENVTEFDIDEEIYSAFFVWKSIVLVSKAIEKTGEGSLSSLNSLKNEDDDV